MNSTKTSKKGLTRRELLKRSLYGSLTASLPYSIVISGCKKKNIKNKPNIIFISIDTLRRDHCSVYGYKLNTTPNLNKLGRKGTIFNLAYAPTPTTGSSHATMFTSLYPITHRKDKNSDTLSSKFLTLAECLRTYGYTTAAIVSSFVLHAKFGLTKGFSSYDDNFDHATATIHGKVGELTSPDEAFDQRGDETTRKAINVLKKFRTSSNPFFLFLHYFDPHAPYVPPEPFASDLKSSTTHTTELEKVILQYDGEVAYTDSQIGKLFYALQRMDLMNNTLIVITSDHGEGLGQHGLLQHTFYIYEEAVCVPLLFYWPGHILKGQVVDTPVALVDIVPTILDLVGIEEDDFLVHGQSLASSLRGKSKLDPKRAIYLHRRHFSEAYFPSVLGNQLYTNGEKFGVRIGNWKYIESKKENLRELFDLKNDPKELRNLYDTYPKKSIELALKLEKWRQSYTGIEATESNVSEDDLLKLKSLGYTD